MSGPGVGGILVGTFLLMCGICLLLVGGGCTLMLLFGALQSPGSSLFSLPLILISGTIGWAGLLLLRAASRNFRG